MNSHFKFLHRVRIHGGECGAVARALHHKARVSLPAVSKIVFGTTNERTKMSRITFKRISLAVVAALSFGMLSSMPSANALTDETLTLSASSATITLGETASVTITNTFIADSIVANLASRVDSNTVYVSASANFGGTVYAKQTTDSANTAMSTTREVTAAFATTPVVAESVVASTIGAYTKQTITLKFYQAATPGTYTYTISTRQGYGLSYLGIAAVKSAIFTLTVTDNRTPDATKSKAFLNKALAAAAVESDSTITTTAGLPTETAAVGVLHFVLRNASDTKTVYPAGTATRVEDSVVVTTDYGLLSVANAKGSSVRSAGAKQVTVAHDETVVVIRDGSAGTASIKAYIGSVAAANLFSTKSVTYVGKATTFTVSDTTPVAAGATNLSAVAADSVASGTGLVTFVAKDVNGSAVDSAALNTNSNFYCISSDSTVVRRVNSATLNYATAAWDSANNRWSCSFNVRDSGTATITVADDTVVATATYTATARSFTFAGAARKGTIAFDKTTYNIGERAIITVTYTDRGGRTVADGTHNPFTDIVQSRPFGSAGKDGANADAGFGSSRAGTAWDLAGQTSRNGVDTFVVFMPNTAGKVTLTGFTEYDSSTQNTPINVSVDVVDPNAALIAAAQAAAEAATDAASEAIDAANAATDAANLSAEAADAATVAAEEARDAADAATAAVEELATQVATLMAALKAQITTLANTVAKIAKKVAKL